MNTQVSSYMISEQAQQEARNTQIWQEAESKNSHQYECSERICWKESKKSIRRCSRERVFQFMCFITGNPDKDLHLYPRKDPDKIKTHTS